MFTIGKNPYRGLVESADYFRGKGATPGQRGMVAVNGDSKEFVAVKLAAGVWINGTVLLLDGEAGNIGAAVTASGAPVPAFNQRVGVLVFASATATQTLATTGYAWAQIWGQCLVRVTASVSAPGIALGMGAGPGAVLQQVGASASAMMHGITALATNTASVVANGVALLSVMLNYPCFIGPPDTNLS